MKEKLYTIELHDAFAAGDECPFCYLERKLEQDAIAFVLGSSYMESDVREQTDAQGFCRRHTKLLYDYGNTLGNAWILKTRLVHVRRELEQEMERCKPAKISVFGRRKAEGRRKADSGANKAPVNSVAAWIREQESRCYLCGRIGETYGRMVDTFLYLLRTEPEFLELMGKSKGFCLHHFGDICEACEEKLRGEEKDKALLLLFGLMKEHLGRIQEDVDWLIEKYDYRNAQADWKNSKDAVPRAMQKLAGGYPADPVFKSQS